jgi:hypothetical protein
MTKSAKTKIVAGIGIAGLLVLGTGGALWMRYFRHYPSREVMRDVRAAIGAKDDPRPAGPRSSTFSTPPISKGFTSSPAT